MPPVDEVAGLIRHIAYIVFDEAVEELVWNCMAVYVFLMRQYSIGARVCSGNEPLPGIIHKRERTGVDYAFSQPG